EFGEAPDLALEVHRQFELVLRGEVGDLDHALLSNSLACRHSDSISSIFDAAGDEPRAANSFSIWPKRRRNLAVVLRSACSGSTLKKRARLTTTKRRSPSSSSSCSGASARRADSSSASSSCSFSITWSGLLQSNPA